MKISFNGESLFELNETQKKVICNDIFEDEFDDDMKRRLEYIIANKYRKCLKRLKDEWEPKLKSKGQKSFPSDDDEFARLVFAQPEYKSRLQREPREEKDKYGKDESEV